MVLLLSEVCFLVNYMNYEPDYDYESSATVYQLSRKIELSNRLTWLLKKYLEKLGLGKKDPNVIFWSANIAASNMEVLKNKLPKIKQTLVDTPHD